MFWCARIFTDVIPGIVLTKLFRLCQIFSVVRQKTRHRHRILARAVRIGRRANLFHIPKYQGRLGTSTLRGIPSEACLLCDVSLVFRRLDLDGSVSVFWVVFTYVIVFVGVVMKAFTEA